MTLYNSSCQCVNWYSYPHNMRLFLILTIIRFSKCDEDIRDLFKLSLVVMVNPQASSATITWFHVDEFDNSPLSTIITYKGNITPGANNQCKSEEKMVWYPTKSMKFESLCPETYYVLTFSVLNAFQVQQETLVSTFFTGQLYHCDSGLLAGLSLMILICFSAFILASYCWCRSESHAGPPISFRNFSQGHGGNRYLELPGSPGYAAAVDPPDITRHLTQLRNNSTRFITNLAINNNPEASNSISNEPIYRTIERTENPYETVSHLDGIYSCAAADNSDCITSPYNFADDNSVNISVNKNDTRN